MLTFNEFLEGCNDDFMAMLEYNEMSPREYYEMVKHDIESQEYNAELERMGEL